MTSIGSIASISRDEKDLTKINFALGQALQRLGGQQVNRSVTVTTNYAVLVSDYQVNISGDATVTLPAASAAPGQIYTFKSLTTGTTATISAASTTDTIDGTTGIKLNTKYKTLRVQSNGATWDRQDNPAAALSQTWTDCFTGPIATIGSTQTYGIAPVATFGATLTTFSAVVQSGSVKATLAINGTAVGGGTISVTTAVQTASLTSANTVSSGDSITIVTSTAATPVSASYTIAYTRAITFT